MFKEPGHRSRTQEPGFLAVQPHYLSIRQPLMFFPLPLPPHPQLSLSLFFLTKIVYEYYMPYTTTIFTIHVFSQRRGTARTSQFIPIFSL
jgi:hypothetical protein